MQTINNILSMFYKIVQNNNILFLGIGLFLLILIVIFYFKKLNSNKHKIKKINQLMKKDMEKALNLLIESNLKVIKTILNQKVNSSESVKIKKFIAKNDNLEKIFHKSFDKEKEENNKHNAAAVFKEINSPQAVDYLITYLYTSDRELVKYTISILQEKKTIKIIESLKEYVKTITDAKILEQIKNVFINFGPESAERLLPLLKDSNPTIIKWTIDILGSYEEKDFTDILINQLKIDNPEVKIAILKNLNATSDKIIPVLINHLEDENWAVRSQAAEELGKTNEDKVASYLYEKLYDRSGMVRNTAANALFTLGDNGIKYLIKAARDEEPPKEAIDILKKQDITALIENMEKIYMDKNKSLTE